jgi:hypothetical protein
MPLFVMTLIFFRQSRLPWFVRPQAGNRRAGALSYLAWRDGMLGAMEAGFREHVARGYTSPALTMMSFRRGRGGGVDLR